MFYASTFTMGKLLLNYLPPIYLIGLRAFFGGLFLLAIQYVWDKKQFFIKWCNVSSLLQYAFFNIYLSFVLEFIAFQYVSSIKVTLIYNLASFITPFYAFIFFGQRMTNRKWLGLSIGLAGVLPILLFSVPKKSLQAFGMISWPEIFLILAVFSFCYGWVHIKKLMLQQYPPLMTNGVTMVWGGIMGLTTAYFFESWQPISHPVPTISLMVGLIIVGNLITSNLWVNLFKYYTISLVAFGSLMVPMFASVGGYFILGETISWDMLVSMIIVSIGLYIFYQEELRQGYIQSRK